MNFFDFFWWCDDFEGVFEYLLDVFLVFKVNYGDDVVKISCCFDEFEEQYGYIKGCVEFILFVMEIVFGVFNIVLMVVSECVMVFIWGVEDLLVDFGLKVNCDVFGKLLLIFEYCCNLMLLVVIVVCILVFDLVFVDICDFEGLVCECCEVVDIGFFGKILIYLVQIDVINEVFILFDEEVEMVCELFVVFEEYQKEGCMVFVFCGQMVDVLYFERVCW